MSLIHWNDALSVNIADIDKQHKKLVFMINELNGAMKQGKGKDVLGKILITLIDYTATHFKTEEKYFDLYKYPETAIHKKEHIAFVRKVSEFKDGFERQELSITIDVMTFLSDWLKNHIKVTDKKYSTFFNDRGLK